MGFHWTVPDSEFGGPKGPPTQEDMLVSGALLLADMSALAGGVPVHDTLHPNLAVAGAASAGLTLPSWRWVNTITAADGEVTRTPRGGVAVVPSLTGTAAARSVKIQALNALATYLTAHPDHDIYISTWGRYLRSPLITGLDMHASLAGSVGRRAAVGISAPSGVLTSDPTSASARRLAFAGDLTFQAVAARGLPDPWTGPTSADLVRIGTTNAASVGKAGAYVLYRLYIADLTAMGLTAAEVMAMDRALHDAAFAPGGRFHGDILPFPPVLPVSANGFETTLGTIEVRRNLASDPRATRIGSITAAGWAAQWYGTGGAGQTTLVTGATDGPEVAPGVRIPTYLRKTWTTTPVTMVDTGFDHTATTTTSVSGMAGLPVTPGQIITASSYVRPNAAATEKRSYIGAVFRDAAGVTVGTAATSAAVSPAPGVWTRQSLTFTVPAGAATVNLATRTSNLAASLWAVGDTFDGTALLVEESPVLRPYMDGIFSPDSDLTPSWVGTANASAAVLTGPGVAGVNTGDPKRAARVSSTQWAASGARSLRVIPTQVSGIARESYGALALSGLVVGQKYEVAGTCRLASPLTGVLSPDVFAPPRGFWLTSVALSNPVYSSTAPNVAGAWPVRATFTAATSTGDLRLIAGSLPGGGDVWWDNVSIVPID